MIGIAFTICGLIFTLLLIIVYFPKKKVNLVENKIYSIIILITLISTIMEIISYLFVVNGISSISPVYNFIIKLLFACFLLWLCMFMLYVVTTGRRLRNASELNLKNKILILILIEIFILFLPVNIKQTNGLLLPEGLCVNVIYFVAAIALLIMCYSLFLSRKF